MSRDIPHIDLRDYHSTDPTKRASFINTLGKGLLEFGFLTVEGHGLQDAMIKQAYDDFRTFFSLDELSKKAYDTATGGARGYTPFGREHAKDSPFPDLKEFWHVGQELPAKHPYHAHYPANVWPHEIPQIKEHTLSMYRSLEKCGITILEALAAFFDLPKTTFSAMVEKGNSILRPIHYPPIQGDADPNSVRAAAHEDINMITLLVESQGAGLEVLTREGNWLAVDALAGDIVVDSGDMLSRATNGVIPATTHRVINSPESQTSPRYSMPFFMHPYPPCDLSVMERFITPKRPAQFLPITAQEFLDQRLAEIGLG